MNIKEISLCELTIKGNIKDVDDCHAIEKAIQNIVKNNNCSRITLNIPKSFSFPSTAMGIMAKMVKKQGIQFSIFYGDKRLGKTLKRLELDKLFNIQKIDKKEKAESL